MSFLALERNFSGPWLLVAAGGGVSPGLFRALGGFRQRRDSSSAELSPAFRLGRHSRLLPGLGRIVERQTAGYHVPIVLNQYSLSTGAVRGRLVSERRRYQQHGDHAEAWSPFDPIVTC